MGTAEIIIVTVVGLAFCGAIAYLLYRKLKHGGGCDFGCSGCPHSCKCHTDKEKNQN